jgi:hypothetical protein
MVIRFFDILFSGLAILPLQVRDNGRTLLPVADYHVPNVSVQVELIVHSYYDFINRVV